MWTLLLMNSTWWLKSFASCVVCLLGDVESAASFARKLLSLGADPSLRSRWTNMSALHYAAYFDVPHLICVVLQASQPGGERTWLSDSVQCRIYSDTGSQWDDISVFNLFQKWMPPAVILTSALPCTLLLLTCAQLRSAACWSSELILHSGYVPPQKLWTELRIHLLFIGRL